MDIKVITRIKDRHGDPVSSTQVTLPALGFAPEASRSGSSSSLSIDHNEQVDRRGTIYFPSGTRDFGPDTLFQFKEHPQAAETVWGIDGDLSQWSYPFGPWAPGFEVKVKRVTG